MASSINEANNLLVSRRAILGALAATSLAVGCQEHHDGYGAPQASTKCHQPPGGECVKDNANVVRANLTLWLLLSTSGQFFPLNYQSGSGQITAANDQFLNSLADDLKYLPGGSKDGRVAYIKSILAQLNQAHQLSETIRSQPQNGKLPEVAKAITYLDALWVVRELFFQMGQGFPNGQEQTQTSVPPPYVPGSGECPRSSREILSIATDSPTALLPPDE